MSHWVVVADAAHARVFVEAPERGGWDELAELGPPIGVDESLDAPEGSFAASPRSAGGNGCFEQGVAEALRLAQDERKFDWLVLVAASPRLRALRAALEPRVSDVITREVDLELADLPAPVVEARLEEALASEAGLR